MSAIYLHGSDVRGVSLCWVNHLARVLGQSQTVNVAQTHSIMNAKEKQKELAGPECANCNDTKRKDGQQLTQKCARCLLVTYCSRECQAWHWKRGDHKKWCVSPKERSVQKSALLTKEDDFKATSDSDAANCPVCLGQISRSENDLIVTLPCLHVFHISCVDDLRSHSLQKACPLCRAELPSKFSASSHHCANCGNEKQPDGTPLVKTCAKCKLVFYCGQDCQRTHWKHGGHKAICVQATSKRIMAELNKPLDFRGTTQLLDAVINNNITKVRNLLNQGAAVNKARIDDGMTPLYAAASHNRVQVASLLLDGGATVNQSIDNDGVSPLNAAAFQGNTEMVRVLLDGGAAVNQAATPEGAGISPLYNAADQGHIKVASLLLGVGAAVNQATTDNGATPLFTAARQGHAKIVSLLISGGAEVNRSTTNNGTSPLYAAAQDGHAKVVGLLLAGGAAVNQAVRTNKNATPLSIAVENGHTKVASQLIDNGAIVVPS